MKQKEVEDVFGGKEEFANADSMGSKWGTSALLVCEWEAYSIYSAMSCRELQWRPSVLLPVADSEC